MALIMVWEAGTAMGFGVCSTLLNRDFMLGAVSEARGKSIVFAQHFFAYKGDPPSPREVFLERWVHLNVRPTPVPQLWV